LVMGKLVGSRCRFGDSDGEAERQSAEVDGPEELVARDRRVFGTVAVAWLRFWLNRGQVGVYY
jgi:hypothetical protein